MWLLLSCLLSASAATPRVGVQYSAGVSGFTGDLSDDFGALTQEVHIKTLYVDGRAERLRGYLSMGMLTTQATHDGSDFAFPEGASLRVLSFLFVAHLCWRPTERLQGCLGLGEGTVNINAPRDRRDFGTWNYAAQLDLELTERLALVTTGRFIGSVEQQIAGRDAAFSLYTATAGLGWAY